jgi:hypothetical protein
MDMGSSDKRGSGILTDFKEYLQVVFYFLQPERLHLLLG